MKKKRKTIIMDKFCIIMQEYVNTLERISSQLVDINGDVNHEQWIWKTHMITKTGSSLTMDRGTESTVGSDNTVEEMIGAIVDKCLRVIVH